MKDWKCVGTRVRLVRPSLAENLNMTGRICVVDTIPNGYVLPSGRRALVVGYPAECVVKWDEPINLSQTHYTPEYFYKLEPIIPEDCSTPSEYSLGELLDKLRTEEVCHVQ